MADAGLPVRLGGREYRPTVAAGRFNAKILKPQNIIEMLDTGFDLAAIEAGGAAAGVKEFHADESLAALPGQGKPS